MARNTIAVAEVAAAVDSCTGVPAADSTAYHTNWWKNCLSWDEDLERSCHKDFAAVRCFAADHKAGSSLDDDHSYLVRFVAAYTDFHIGFPAGVHPYTVVFEHGSGEMVELSVHIPFVLQDFARRTEAAGT